MRRLDWWFVIFRTADGRVVGFSKVIRINGEPCPIFEIWHDPNKPAQQLPWLVEILDPRVKKDEVRGIHLRQVAWKCGYPEEKTGEITKLAQIFNLLHPSRKRVAEILKVPRNRVRISIAPPGQ